MAACTASSAVSASLDLPCVPPKPLLNCHAFITSFCSQLICISGLLLSEDISFMNVFLSYYMDHSWNLKTISD